MRRRRRSKKRVTIAMSTPIPKGTTQGSILDMTPVLIIELRHRVPSRGPPRPPVILSRSLSSFSFLSMSLLGSLLFFVVSQEKKIRQDGQEESRRMTREGGGGETVTSNDNSLPRSRDQWDSRQTHTQSFLVCPPTPLLPFSR